MVSVYPEYLEYMTRLSVCLHNFDLESAEYELCRAKVDELYPKLSSVEREDLRMFVVQLDKELMGT